ncbi:undecaprenyl-diphosphatase [Arboricoccus pini]|uniref:Undecaprenyl-diphosphatase n=1 Tax=Arboricoccus pini TaxID=1963835 RepID=A0A212QTH4_9PROT|nr:undecaprenyl-diphosphate phosphatase [Arboricoccus pini]SNB62940.1 undecaprenyl-diphosphatase [Arboricoccus pini]
MDVTLVLKAVVLGIIEGATEFLPVSSTGHLILASYFLDFQGQVATVFKIVIQLGSILAICVLYFGKLWRMLIDLPTRREAQMFVLSIIVAFIPAAVLGFALEHFITSVLFSPWVVAVALIVGGILILLIERRTSPHRYPSVDHIPLGTALAIGFCQTIAMIPGVSRSGATILGSVLLGVERRAAAEFSFFLAIPTMLGATVLEMYKNRALFQADDLMIIGIGFIVAFIVALIVVRAFVRYLQNHTFSIFGWYRIAVGIVMLIVLFIYGTNGFANA